VTFQSPHPALDWKVLRTGSCPFLLDPGVDGFKLGGDMKTPSPPVAGIAALLLILPPNHAAAASPYPRAKVPPDGRMTLTDYGTRAWGPELVHYAFDTNRFAPGRLALLGPDGKGVPFQVEGGVLAFVANLPQGGTVSYTLQGSATDRSTENSTLHLGQSDRAIEIANEFLALRLPAVGERSYPNGVEAAKVPPPIRQWKQAGQEWMGGTRFATPRKVTAHVFTLARQGPACLEFEARYRFAPKGEYVCRIRLSPGMPLALVSEEFDMGETTKGEDVLLLDLHANWQPQNIGWTKYGGEQNPARLDTRAFAAYVEGKRDARPPEAPVGGVGQAPVLPLPESGLVALDRIMPVCGGVQVWDGELRRPGQERSIGLVALHSGSWRRTMVLQAWHKAGTGVVIGLPISVRPARWSLEVTDDFSPFSTHEHDEGLPRTYGRREWGLHFGPGFETAQPQFGHIGLDRYKDWVVEWPESEAAKKAFPGAWFRRGHVERLRQAIDQHPMANELRNRYLISGRTEDAVRNAQTVIAKLKRPYLENDFWLWGLANYRKAQLLVFVNEAEDALACPALPAGLRQELRRWLALCAYVTSDPDWNPRGNGAHLGNNNMPINRTLALAYFAGLLPDHACYDYWMEQVREFTRFKLTSQFSPFGESLECPCYQLYAPAGALNVAQNILRNRGKGDFLKEGSLRRNLAYLAKLTMPDPRYRGARIIPGMGNGGNLQESIWGVSVATFLDQDPAFAGWCKAMFKAAGEKFGPISTGVTFVGHPMYYLPDVPEAPLNLTSTFLPAYGVAFRAHAGTPHETAMLLRAGTDWGHWDYDALNVILYGKGAPLSPGTGYQYYSGTANKDNALYHNQVKVGQRDLQEVFGRVDDTIEDYGLMPDADYAVADRYYPPEIFADKKGGMHWRRHVLFLKSSKPEGPSYFVMRDTFPGGAERPKWWTWMNLETPDKITVEGRAFAKDQVPVEKVIPETDMPVLRGQTVEMATDFGASTWFWFTETRDVRVRGLMRYGASGLPRPETKTILEVLAGPRQDYFYVVYPRKNGEAAPECRRLAEGVLRIKTAESTDYVFIADKPVKFAGENVVFTGKAGAVRVFADRVAFCMSSGEGEYGYQGLTTGVIGPFENSVPLGDPKPGTGNVPGGNAKKVVRPDLRGWMYYHPQVKPYAKEIMTVELGQGIQARGEGPFEAKLEGETIRIKTRGRARILHVTQPPFITRPQFWIDGQEHMASWTDYPASGWGTYQNTWLMALSAPEGDHDLVVKDFRFPPVWARPFEPLIGATRKR
jgi:hypothetical protein